MPECPNCHEYYFGTLDECPKCHKKISSVENNTPSAKQNGSAAKSNLSESAVEKTAIKKFKLLLIIPLIYYAWCLCSSNHFLNALTLAGLICTLIVFIIAASKKRNEVGALKLLLLIPIIEQILSLLNHYWVFYDGEITPIISYVLRIIALICTMIAFFRGGFGFLKAKGKSNDIVEKTKHAFDRSSEASSVMYSNIGRKIKTLAKVFCWIGIISSVVSGIVVLATMGDAGVLLGILTIVMGPLLFWIGSFILYGFGQLVENSDIRTELAVKAATGEKEG